ncbi:MAG: hypothetical protein OEM52_06835 [bacterium]|nr:hypothetical protein [bacterium]
MLFPEHISPGDLVKVVANSAPIAVRLTAIRTGLQEVVKASLEPNRPLTANERQTAALERIADPNAANADSLLLHGSQRVMYVDGTISDNALYAEATVLQYVLKLEESKLFGTVKVIELTPVTNRNANARFRLELGLGN